MVLLNVCDVSLKKHCATQSPTVEVARQYLCVGVKYIFMKYLLSVLIIFISACASNALTWQDGHSSYLKLNCKQENEGKYWGECYLDKRMNDPNYEKIVSNQERTGYPVRQEWDQILKLNELAKNKIADGASVKEVNKIFEDVLDGFNESFTKYQEDKAAEQRKNWAIALAVLGGTAASLQNTADQRMNNQETTIINNNTIIENNKQFLRSSEFIGSGTNMKIVCYYSQGGQVTLPSYMSCPVNYQN